MAATVLVVSLLTGLIAMAVALFVDNVELLAFGERISEGDAGVTGVPAWRLFTAMVLGGAVSGCVWFWVRRRRLVTVKSAIAGQRLTWGTVGDAVAQLLAVGSGASVGKEAAPRQIAAWGAQQVIDRTQLRDADRATVLAAAAGAGLGAIYNVPIAGAVMSVELLLRPNLRTLAGWRQAAMCLVTSIIATITAWPVIGRRPVYDFHPPHLPALTSSAFIHLIWVLLVVVVGCQAAADAFGSLARYARVHSSTGLWLPASLGVAGVVVALVSLWAPQVPGNGRPMMQLALLTPPGLWICLGLLVAKSLATAVSFRGGASGGMLTPTLAIGAMLGAALGQLLDPRLTVLTALAGAAVALAVTQHAPVFAIIFTLELTGASLGPGLLTIAAVACGYGLHLLRHRATDHWWGRRAE